MSGRIVRMVCTASLAAAVSVPQAPAAAAAPPDRRPPPPSTELLRATPVVRPGAEWDVAGLLTRLQGLYAEAEEATEAYNATEQELGRQRTRSRRLDRRLHRARRKLADGRREAGLLAARQYRGTVGLSLTVRSLLDGDLRGLSDQGHELRRAADRQGRTVDRLTRAERRAGKLAARAHTTLGKRRTLTTRRKKQRDTVTRRLRRIEASLASLSETQLSELRQRERRDVAGAQRALIRSRALPRTENPPSADGDKALRYALRQIGKPYAWGAEGPRSFDCSGLTSSAWAYAGRSIPRTSQQQWRELPHVPLDQLRPGDLVVYYARASHVALYAGDGKVVQAPRPGTTVRLSPLASNPPLGAVRPDPGSPPMEGYLPPPLKEN
ncbi:hypothetical protein ACZ90_57670 [Streptomyces albus subsp. albus]|nr:hypothetical protein ACZ90_57670 [Streptomyces albus subsp. albus]